MSTTSSEPSNLSGQSGEIRDARQALKEIEEAELPQNKEAGKMGRAIKLRTNYYRMAVAPNKIINHFDVTIKETNATLGKESVKTREEKMKFFLAFVAENLPQAENKISYDGMSNAYYFTDLTDGGKGKVGKENKLFNFDYAPRGTRKRPFQVLLRKVNSFNSNDINEYLSGHTATLKQEQIQAYDVILRHTASTKMICHGRNFFDPDTAGQKDLGGGREVLSGYYQSVRAISTRSGGSLAMNIDVANTAFLKQILATDFAKEVLNPRGGIQDVQGRSFWTDSLRKRFESDCKGVQFWGTHLKGGAQKTWRCSGLSKYGAAQQQISITDANGKNFTTTVADYYRKTYNITLRFPNMPLIINGSPKNPEKVKYFPPELMKIAPRQAHKGKLNEIMTSNMIRAVATPAPVRQRDTDNMAKKAINNATPMAAQYGVKLNSQMEQVEGRVLDAPKLDYQQKGKTSTVTPRQGAWDTRDCGFLKAMGLQNWVILNNGARLDQRRLEEFANGLCKSGHFAGMKIAAPSQIFHIRNQNDLDNKLRLCKQNKVQLALVIMPRRSTAEYSFIKTTSEVGYGTMTQCIQARNVERANAQLFGNLLQKINTKLGGTNTVVSKASKPQLFAKPVMVVGLSIAHGSPGSNTPSIVSATFSCDAAVYRYIHKAKLQEKGVGLITCLKELMIEGCKGFYGQTRVKPAKIVVYRLGGSEGELGKIAGYEVKQCKEAFASLPGFNPGLTFICVNKMHRTRLFAESERDRIGKSQNVPAGTIVDNGITARDRYDFYLCSSQGIQGTSRPTHYTLIYDDNGLSADSINMMTWTLCHGYARCTRSVSLPVPVFYAELNRERTARYLHEIIGGSDAGSMMSGRGDGGSLPSIQELQKRCVTHKELPNMNYV